MRRLSPAVLAVSLVASPLALAQPKVQANYPTLATPANIGGTAGQAAALTLTGTNLTDVTGVWTSFGGTTTIPDGQKDATKLTVSVAVPAGTPVGLYSLRVATATGISNLRTFVVDELPVVAEAADNTKRETPQAVPHPCVVVGGIAAESADFFKVSVKAGEALTVEALGRRIGSPFDPVVIFRDTAGKELPGLYADDTPGLQGDARVTHTFAAAADVIVEVRDASYRGGPDFAYRLRVGAFPGVTTAFPLAVERGKTAGVGFAGPALEGVKPVSVKGDGEVVYATPKAGAAGWPVPVLIADDPQSVEQEPNDHPEKANPLPVPGGVSARFDHKGDVDHFKFSARKGQKLALTALTYEVNAPTEVYLRILDAKGAELAKSNPVQAGVRVEFDPPADGEYVAACEHTNYLFGPNEVYHLSVRPVTPDFVLTAGLDRADVPVGGVGLLPITGLAKLNGFAGAVTVEFVGAGVSGSLVIPPAANPLPAAPLYLPLTAKPGTKAGPVVGTLRATAKVDGKDLTHTVSLMELVKGSLATMPTPPPEMTSQMAVAVTPESPFTLAVTVDKPEVAKGGTLKGKVTVKRADKFDADIQLSVVGTPAGAVPKLVPIPKGASEAAIELTVPAAAPPGPVVLLLRGAAKANGKDVSALAVPLTFTVAEPKK